MKTPFICLRLAVVVAGWGMGCAERALAWRPISEMRPGASATPRVGQRNTLADAVTAQKAEAAATLHPAGFRAGPTETGR